MNKTFTTIICLFIAIVGLSGLTVEYDEFDQETVVTSGVINVPGIKKSIMMLNLYSVHDGKTPTSQPLIMLGVANMANIKDYNALDEGTVVCIGDSVRIELGELLNADKDYDYPRVKQFLGAVISLQSLHKLSRLSAYRMKIGGVVIDAPHEFVKAVKDLSLYYSQVKE